MGKNKKISDKPKEILSSMKTAENDSNFAKNNFTSIIKDTEEDIEENIKDIEESLKREIISNDGELGFCVNQEYTDLGNNQLVFKNSYETKLMFQTSFYVKLFAQHIAKNLLEVIKEKEKEITKIILIGYKGYSEFLLSQVKEILKKSKKIKEVRVVLAEDDSDGKIRFIGNTNKCSTRSYVTIVPINSTLRTNDKIASFWKQMLYKKYSITEPKESVYNHCVIVVKDKTTVVRDCTTEEPTEKEQHFWVSIDNAKKVINTNFKNAEKIHYTIQITSKDNEQHNWINRINSVFFPKKYVKEKYIHPLIERTLNTRPILGFPTNVVPLDQDKHIEEIKRLKELKDYIYSGHIEAFGTHHRYYIDTEAFIRSDNEEYKKWLLEIKWEEVFDLEKYTHILVTSSYKIESKFVNNINDIIFHGRADIVNLELNDSTENAISFLSHLRSKYSQKVVQYHFVDHVLLTGDTYWRIRSFLNSFADIQVYSIFSLINRMPNSKTTEIKQSVNNNLFTFLTLNYPAIKQNGKECYLCKLTKYYETLKEHSVSEICQEVIENNKEKLKLKKRSELLANKDKKENEIRFYRLLLTHELLYLISQNIKDTNDYSENKTTIKKLLDEIYYGLIDKKDYIKISSSQIIDLSQTISLFKNPYDAKITFIKTLATPPLSNYAVIREYAHTKLLNILYETLNTSSPSEGDLKLLKSTLKSLSYLKSNALIRKEVITKSWEFLYKLHETNIINESYLEKFGEDFSFYIKNAIFSDTAKSYYLGELLRTGKEPGIEDSMNLAISKTSIDNELFSLFKEGQNKTEKDDKKQRPKEKIYLKYIDFLKSIFYDNTTILRKTLNHIVFEFEEQKGRSELRKYFYDNNNKLKPFKKSESKENDVLSNISEIKKIFNNIIENEYYYGSFKPYLCEVDDINYLEKLIYLAYAKLKLNELINHKEGVEQDTKDLIVIFTKIMGADSAFLAMNLEKQPHVISTYGMLNDREEWDYNNWFLQNNYSTRNALTGKNIKAPIVQNFNIDSSWGEKRDLRAHSLALYLIGEANKNYGTITFLYYANNSIIKSSKEKGEEIFKVKVQEFGRLLLLLKQEIDKYFIDFLLKEKVLDLWVKNKENKQLSDKYENLYEDLKSRYRNNSHNAIKHLDNVLRNIFQNENSNPHLIALLSDIYIGDIHRSLILQEKKREKEREKNRSQKINSANTQSLDIKEVLNSNVIHAMKNYLIGQLNVKFQKEKIIFEEQSFNEKMYSDSIDYARLIFFQLICNIDTHTDQNKLTEAVIKIYVEKNYIIFANTCPSKKAIQNIEDTKKRLEKEEVPLKSISLFCINTYVKKLTKKEIIIDYKEKEDLFEVRLPLVVSSK